MLNASTNKFKTLVNPNKATDKVGLVYKIKNYNKKPENFILTPDSEGMVTIPFSPKDIKLKTSPVDKTLPITSAWLIVNEVRKVTDWFKNDDDTHSWETRYYSRRFYNDHWFEEPVDLPSPKDFR